MANPWTKKNPLMSMFLSGANVAAGKTRSLWMHQAKRAQTTAAKQSLSSAVDFWFPISPPKRKRRK